MATESFHRVLQGQELLCSRTHGVACAHSPHVPEFLTSDRRRFSVEFPYQPLGFSESLRFSEVLQGQEMSRVVPLYHGNTSDACIRTGRVGSSDYAHRPAVAQGYSLPQFALSAAEVCSPSSVLTVNQTMVPQSEFEGSINLEDAYNNCCAPLEQMQTKEDWPCVTESNQFGMNEGLTLSNVSKPGSAFTEVGRSSCRLFGFSLTETTLVEQNDDGKDGNYSADRQTPRALELFGHSQSTPSPALHALCAAPLGL